MYVYQIIGRANTPEDAQGICRLLGHSLARTQEPGYIGGFCAITPQDRRTVLIQEQWSNPAGLHAWQATDAYQRLRSGIQPLMEGLWETIEYKTES